MNEIEKAILTEQLKELLTVTKDLSNITERYKNIDQLDQNLKEFTKVASGSMECSQKLSEQISKLSIPKSIEVRNKTTVKLDNVSITAALILVLMLIVAIFFHWQLKKEVAQKDEFIEFAMKQKMPKAIELVAVPQISVYEYLMTQKEKKTLMQLEY